MRVTTKLVIDMNSGSIVEHEFYEYDGPIALAGGGPSPEQKSAASANAALSSKLGDVADRNQQFVERQQAKAEPFYTSRMNGGLPYFDAATDQTGGVLARSYQPARAALSRRLSSFGSLPSGYADAAYRDLDTDQAHQYDDNLMGILGANEQAKQAGASGILGQAQLANPMAAYQGAIQGNQTVLNANLRKPGLAGIIGGAAGGAASSFFG